MKWEEGGGEMSWNLFTQRYPQILFDDQLSGHLYVCEMNVMIVCLLSRNLGHSWKVLVKFRTESVSLWFLDSKVYTVPETQHHIPVESARQSQQERIFSWRATAAGGGFTQRPAGSNLQTWTRPKRQQMCTRGYGRCHFGRDFILS